MKAKVKELFSKFSVKAYDYPFIVGFLEANGIDNVVPTINMNSRMCIDYEIFKDWWKQNCTQKQTKCDDASVNEANPYNVNVEYTISFGDKHVTIDMAEVLDEFVKYNTEQAGHFLFERPHFKDLGYFIRKHLVSDILD